MGAFVADSLNRKGTMVTVPGKHRQVMVLQKIMNIGNKASYRNTNRANNTTVVKAILAAAERKLAATTGETEQAEAVLAVADACYHPTPPDHTPPANPRPGLRFAHGDVDSHDGSNSIIRTNQSTLLFQLTKDQVLYA